jgi:replicative DNA helicase
MPTYTSPKSGAEEKIIPMRPALPANEPAERAAISCIIQDLTNLDRATWPEDLFFYPQHRELLACARRCREKGASADYFAIEADLVAHNLLEAVGGHQGLMDFWTLYPKPDAGIAAYHREILAETARYRKACTLAQDASREFAQQTGSITDAATALAEISSAIDRPRASLATILGEVITDIERKEPPEAFSTRIPTLDHLTAGGPKRGELAVIAAETSGGKSILLLQIALAAALRGKHVAVFSLEMPAKDVARRMVSNHIGIRVKNITEGFNGGELDAITSGIHAIGKLPLQIESGYSDWESIEACARELRAKDKLDLLVLDYIQLVHLRDLAKNETREQHVSEITRRLKSLALTLNIATATASQLNEDGRLRESRAIGHHADHVWLINPNEDGPVLRIEKNRSGERDRAIPLFMRGDISRFEERTTKKEPTK